MSDKIMKADKSTEEVMAVVKCMSHDQVKSSEVQEMYGKWAEQYDKDLQGENYNQPAVLVDVVEKFYDNQRDMKILDVGAGTGAVGKLLFEKGFKNLDALDPSGNMLERAKKTGCYQQFFEDFMGKNRLNIPNDYYDAVVSNGAFAPGHINEECYEELARITQRGGHIFIFTRARYLTETPEYARNLELRMLELQAQGLWKRVRKEFINYVFSGEQKGVLFILQKC